MLHRALEQFLSDVHWGPLDYLVIDMPPGTGDVGLSLGQLMPRAEALMVTTPQPAAQRVAERGGAMVQKVGQTLLGVVENMSGYACPCCGEHDGAVRRGRRRPGSPSSSACRCSARCRSSPRCARAPTTATP